MSPPPSAAPAPPPAMLPSASPAPGLPPIRRQLGVRIVGLVVLALLVFSSLVYWLQIRPLVDRQVEAEMGRAATRISDRMNALVGAVEGTLKTTSHWAQDGVLKLDDIQAFNRLMMPAIAAQSVIGAAFLANDQGDEIALLQTPNGWKTRSTRRSVWGDKQHWQNWRDARTPMGTEWQVNDYDSRSRLWYLGAMNIPVGELWWSAPEIIIATGLPGITVSMRWQDATTGRTWVAAIVVDLLDLSHFTNQLLIREQGRAALLTGDDKVIGMPNHLKFSTDEEISAGLLKDPANIGLTRIAGALLQWRQHEAGPRSGDKTFTFLAPDKWIGIVTALPVRNQEFFVVTVAPYADFMPLSQQFFWIFTGILLGLIALAAMLANRLANQLATPLRRLAKESERLGAMELDAPISGIDSTVAEIAEMAEAHEAMRHSLLRGRQDLRDANRSLESKVVQRTAALDLSKRAMADQLAFQRALIDTMPYPVFYKSADARYLGVNRAYEQTLQVRREDIIGKTIAELSILPQALRLTMQREDETAIATASSVRREAQMPFGDGVVHETIYHVAGFRNADGSPGGLVGTFVDISEQKAAQRVITQAKDVAEEAARMKSDFLANMSHEIRTPMNAIIGMAHLALKTELSPRQRDYVQKIQSSGLHLLGILNDILDFSKIDAGKLDVEQVNFSLDQLLDGIATLITEKANAKGLELVFDIAPDVPQNLIGDALRISQILVNYANNAVKFTETGEVDIVIRVQERSANAALLCFTVRDTGIGLSAEQMARLFQSFQQGDTSTTRKYGGTGLGLSISKKLAELMGGQVGVDSELAKGSAFWFTVRVGIGKQRARLLLPRPDLRYRHVLVVDDNASARAVMNDLLQSMTFQVVEVDSGAAAIAAVRQRAGSPEAFEIIFLDWQMPGMNGVESAQQINALELTPPPHLIMATAYGREDVIKQAYSAGIENVLTKPVSGSALFDTAIRALGGDELPVDADTDTDNASSLSMAARLNAELGRISGARILLVEDNELNQEVAEELLRDAGLVVEIAADGALAVERVCRNTGAPWDLVLMDMQMPVMDGVTATRLIRQDERFAQLPIVAMTANAMQQDKDKCLDAGMQDFVIKPIEPEKLFSTLLRWIMPTTSPTTSPSPLLAPPSTSPPTPAGVPTKMPEADNEPIPEGIAGLDTASGLRRVLNKRHFYLAVLRKFQKGQRKTSDHIRDALASADLVTAERLAHTLKGLAGNVGASDVQAAAAALESAIKDRLASGEIDRCLLALAQGMAALLAQLDDQLPAGRVGALPAIDPAQLVTVTQRLQALLADDDAEASEIFDQNTALLSAAYPEFFRQISEAIRGFDFEAALSLLTAAAAQQERSI